MSKTNKKTHQKTSTDMNTQLIDVALVSLILTFFNYFASCSAFSYVNIEPVNVSWKLC